MRFTYAADSGAHDVGLHLDRLVQLRGQADYELTANRFDTALYAQESVNRAAVAIPILDAIEADPVRRAAVIADMRARWP